MVLRFAVFCFSFFVAAAIAYPVSAHDIAVEKPAPAIQKVDATELSICALRDAIRAPGAKLSPQVANDLTVELSSICPKETVHVASR